jgi:putative flippase GtrA
VEAVKAQRIAAYCVLGLFGAAVVLSALDRTYQVPPALTAIAATVAGVLFARSANGKPTDDKEDAT